MISARTSAGSADLLPGFLEHEEFRNIAFQKARVLGYKVQEGNTIRGYSSSYVLKKFYKHVGGKPNSNEPHSIVGSVMTRLGDPALVSLRADYRSKVSGETGFIAFSRYLTEILQDDLLAIEVFGAISRNGKFHLLMKWKVLLTPRDL